MSSNEIQIDKHNDLASLYSDWFAGQRPFKNNAKSKCSCHNFSMRRQVWLKPVKSTYQWE